MNSPQAGQVSIVFGDAFSCYIRCVNDGLSGARLLGGRYADSGRIGRHTISWWDFKLALTVIAVHSPFSILKQSSELHRLTTGE